MDWINGRGFAGTKGMGNNVNLSMEALRLRGEQVFDRDHRDNLLRLNTLRTHTTATTLSSSFVQICANPTL